MNRHGYTGSIDNKSPTSPVPFGYGGRSYTSGESGRGFKIKTDSWDEKYHPRSARAMIHSRKSTLTRLGALLTTCMLILMYFFPILRPTTILESLFPPGEEFNIETVRYYDLSNVGGTSRGWEREERILLCAPLRDAAPHLPMFFSHLKNLTYPHNLIDLAFLVGDSKDDTASLLSDLLADLQQPDRNPKDWFGEISVIEKDFGQKVNQDVESRHGFAAQAGRRKSMAQARNWLLSAALRPVHSWVYWRDVDVETAPFTILEDLMRHNKDVIVPNVWRPLPEWLGGEQPYDLNSWQESETALALAETLDEDAVIVEGYAEYATWRPHLAYLRDPYGDPDMEMEIDGVGGVSILAKAKVFRSGVHFPAFSFEKHAETEGFGKMAKRMQFSVVGLPHYTIWHLYEPSFDDIRHMDEMKEEQSKREEEERLRKERVEKIERQFDTDAKRQFEKDKEAMRESRKAALDDARGEAEKKAEDGAANAEDKIKVDESVNRGSADSKLSQQQQIPNSRPFLKDRIKEAQERAPDRVDSGSPSLEKEKAKERAAAAAAAEGVDTADHHDDFKQAQVDAHEARILNEPKHVSGEEKGREEERKVVEQEDKNEWRDPRKIGGRRKR